MLGVHRWPLLTGMELTSYRDWLTQRRQLAQPGAFCWTWVQTHVPDWFLATGLRPARGRRLHGAARPAGRADPADGLRRRRQRLPRPRLLVRPLPGRQPHRPRPPAGPGPAQPGTGDAGADAGRGPRADLDRHVDGRRSRRRSSAPRQAVLVLPMWIGGGAQYVPGQDAVSDTRRVGADDPAVVGGVGDFAGRGAVDPSPSASSAPRASRCTTSA